MFGTWIICMNATRISLLFIVRNHILIVTYCRWLFFYLNRLKRMPRILLNQFVCMHAFLVFGEPALRLLYTESHFVFVRYFGFVLRWIVMQGKALSISQVYANENYRTNCWPISHEKRWNTYIASSYTVPIRQSLLQSWYLTYCVKKFHDFWNKK